MHTQTLCIYYSHTHTHTHLYHYTDLPTYLPTRRRRSCAHAGRCSEQREIISNDRAPPLRFHCRGPRDPQRRQLCSDDDDCPASLAHPQRPRTTIFSLWGR